MGDMYESYHKRKWKDGSRQSYPDVSCKDAPVLPDLPVPKCDCGRPAYVKQSRCEDTVVRAFYECPDSRVSDCNIWNCSIEFSDFGKSYDEIIIS